MQCKVSPRGNQRRGSGDQIEDLLPKYYFENYIKIALQCIDNYFIGSQTTFIIRWKLF